MDYNEGSELPGEVSQPVIYFSWPLVLFLTKREKGGCKRGNLRAWHPLLKSLREKGAGTGPIAIFLHSRAVKPFLLPVMIASFGWVYVVILTALTVFASIAIGNCMSVLIKK